MRLLVSLSFLFFTSVSSAITVTENNHLNDGLVSNVIEDSNFNVDMFHRCSIRLDEKLLPVKGVEKITFSADSIFLASDKTVVQFNLSANNKTQLLLQLSKQKENCAKRVREYRRHPAF